MPLIETKKALKGMEKDETLKIILDNEISVKNVVYFLNDNGYPVQQNNTGDRFEIVVNKKDEDDLEQVDETSYCTPMSKPNGYAVVFTKDRIGEGSDELGEALVGAMMHSFIAADEQPRKIIFMNSGINLVLNRSLVLPQLKELESKGVELISCGTCLDYFGKMDDQALSRISNMQEIVESMLETDKVITI